MSRSLDRVVTVLFVIGMFLGVIGVACSFIALAMAVVH